MSANSKQTLKLIFFRLCLCLNFLIDPPSLAEALPQIFFHPSSAGMGGAYTAIANDDSAPFTNPAGIARIRKARSREKYQLLRTPQFILGTNDIDNYAEIISLQGRHLFSSLDWDEDIKGKYVQMDSFSSGLPSIDKFDQKLSKIFKNDRSKSVWGRVDIGFLGIFEAAKNLPISLGFYTTSEGSLSVNDASVSSASDINNNTMIKFSDVINIMPVLGTSLSDKTKRVNFGLQIRPVYRYTYEGTNPLSDYGNEETIDKETKENSNSDSALAIDMGFMWTLADFWYPTFALAVFNVPTGCDDYLNPYDQETHKVCGTNFKSSKTKNKNSIYNLDPTDIRMGIAISPRISRTLSWRLAIDYHYITYQLGNDNYGLPAIPTIQKTHLGLELYVGNPLEMPSMRAKVGFNQGLFTLGFHLDLDFIQVDFASFGVDLSTDSTPQADRRSILGISIGF